MIERRSTTVNAEAGAIRLTIPFGSWSEDLGGFRERILPTAFNRSLTGSEDIAAFWSHDPSKPLATRSNGSLALSTDGVALTAVITPDGASWGTDAQRSIGAGTVTGSSFAFQVNEGGDRFYRESGTWRRDLSDVRLIEVSPTISPAYPDSTAEVTV